VSPAPPHDDAHPSGGDGPLGESSLRLDERLIAALDTIGHEFQADFFARALIGRNDDVELLSDLAHALTRVGRHAEGLEIDRRVVELSPEDPTAHYNLACSLSLTGSHEEALAELTEAVDLGFSDHALARTDPDLEAVRTDPRFGELFGGA
jgi:tetratricopeptide (TPR) repeat protein